ncbi:MAG: leucyl aminopeptidase, partial [Rhodoluna sp.]|nr:leucyl aminopeptidase [Rhodoluna sp.]
MTSPKLNIAPKFTSFTKGAAYVVGLTTKDEKAVIADTPIEVSSIAQLDLASLGIKATAESTARVTAPNGAIYLLIGLGKQKLDAFALRSLAGAAARALTDVKEIIFGLPIEDKDSTEALFEGALLGRYQFGAYRGLNKLPLNQNAKITVITTHKPTPAALDRVEVITSAVAATQDLVNSPANDIYPQSLAAAIQKAARGTGATVEIWDEKRLAADGFGGILGVGKGSSRPPRLVRIEYKPKNAKAHLAYVGKGITFDSGGLSIKPA